MSDAKIVYEGVEKETIDLEIPAGYELKQVSTDAKAIPSIDNHGENFLVVEISLYFSKSLV